MTSVTFFIVLLLSIGITHISIKNLFYVIKAANFLMKKYWF